MTTTTTPDDFVLRAVTTTVAVGALVWWTLACIRHHNQTCAQHAFMRMLPTVVLGLFGGLGTVVLACMHRMDDCMWSIKRLSKEAKETVEKYEATTVQFLEKQLGEKLQRLTALIEARGNGNGGF